MTCRLPIALLGVLIVSPVTVVEAKKTWSDPPVDEKEVDEWGEVEDEEY